MNTICFWSGDQRGKQGLHGRKCELESLAAIRLAPPQTTFGIRGVSHPLPIPGEVHSVC